jgi:hypothetical protein
VVPSPLLFNERWPKARRHAPRPDRLAETAGSDVVYSRQGWNWPLQHGGVDRLGMIMYLLPASCRVPRTGAADVADCTIGIVVSRKEFEASKMRRLKRIAGRHGLTILTAEKLTSKMGKGGHAIREDESYNVIFGNSPMPYSATFDEIEAYVEKLEADEE